MCHGIYSATRFIMCGNIIQMVVDEFLENYVTRTKEHLVTNVMLFAQLKSAFNQLRLLIFL